MISENLSLIKSTILYIMLIVKNHEKITSFQLHPTVWYEYEPHSEREFNALILIRQFVMFQNSRIFLT